MVLLYNVGRGSCFCRCPYNLYSHASCCNLLISLLLSLGMLLRRPSQGTVEAGHQRFQSSAGLLVLELELLLARVLPIWLNFLLLLVLLFLLLPARVVCSTGRLGVEPPLGPALENRGSEACIRQEKTRYLPSFATVAQPRPHHGMGQVDAHQCAS